jgi:membrane protein involved in colicin uptake
MISLGPTELSRKDKNSNTKWAAIITAAIGVVLFSILLIGSGVVKP